MIPASSKPLWILGVIGVVLVVLLALFVYIAYSSRNVRFEISDEGLRIHGGVYRRLIPPEALINEEAWRGLRPQPKATRQPGTGAGADGLPRGENLRG